MRQPRNSLKIRFVQFWLLQTRCFKQNNFPGRVVLKWRHVILEIFDLPSPNVTHLSHKAYLLSSKNPWTPPPPLWPWRHLWTIHNLAPYLKSATIFLCIKGYVITKLGRYNFFFKKCDTIRYRIIIPKFGIFDTVILQL